MNEVIRYPLRTTSHYLYWEQKLRKTLGSHAQLKLVLASLAIMGPSFVVIFLYGDTLVALIVAYIFSFIGSIGFRIGLNLGHPVPSDILPLTSPFQKFGGKSAQNDPKATLLADRTLRHFRRAFATEHFFRKRARQLAIYMFLIAVPFFHLGWNKRFFPFRPEEGFDSDRLNQLMIFGAIMVGLDVLETTYSRVVFNKALKLDTFTDSLALIANRRVEISFLLIAVHILSDVFLALNQFQFCD